MLKNCFHLRKFTVEIVYYNIDILVMRACAFLLYSLPFTRLPFDSKTAVEYSFSLLFQMFGITTIIYTAISMTSIFLAVFMIMMSFYQDIQRKLKNLNRICITKGSETQIRNELRDAFNEFINSKELSNFNFHNVT